MRFWNVEKHKLATILASPSTIFGDFCLRGQKWPSIDFSVGVQIRCGWSYPTKNMCFVGFSTFFGQKKKISPPLECPTCAPKCWKTQICKGHRGTRNTTYLVILYIWAKNDQKWTKIYFPVGTRIRWGWSYPTKNMCFIRFSSVFWPKKKFLTPLAHPACRHVRPWRRILLKIRVFNVSKTCQGVVKSKKSHFWDITFSRGKKFRRTR